VTPARRHRIDAGKAKPRPAPSSSAAPALDVFIARLADLDADQLRLQWRNHLGGTPPAHLPRWLLARVLAQRVQVATLGDLDRATLRMIRQAKGGDGSDIRLFAPRDPARRDGVGLKAGALLVREWNGAPQRVMVLENGFAWNGKNYASLSQIAEANHRNELERPPLLRAAASTHRRRILQRRGKYRPPQRRRHTREGNHRCRRPDLRPCPFAYRWPRRRSSSANPGGAMKPVDRPAVRCAIYTRVSTEHGLEQEFNSLDNQREASEAYIKSQSHEGWRLIRDRYDDGGYSGASMERPALRILLDDVRAKRVDVVVVYKVDRLTRSLADFAKLVELFDAHGVCFVSVTKSFNTITSIGRLTLNVLLSFAQATPKNR
jgi:predicted site-specific integrase-resolvase